MAVLAFRRMLAVASALLCFFAPFGRAAAPQEGQEASPVAALTSALMAACRQSETRFSRYLTAENAATFAELPAAQRAELMKRFVLLGEAGRAAAEQDPQGRTLVKCEGREMGMELRLGPERLRENLAFVPVEVTGGRRIEMGMVREGGGWRIVSVGLLLLNLAELSRQWAAQELESREAQAISWLRRLADAVATYKRAFGRLPEKLEQLGPAPKEGVSPEAAQLVDAELAAGGKCGYRFRYRILPPAEEGATPNFELAATPVEYGKSGVRSFFLDAAGRLRGGDKQGGVATSADPIIEVERRPTAP